MTRIRVQRRKVSKEKEEQITQLEYQLQKIRREYTTEEVGDIELVNEFWECECDENYIHLKENELVCPICEGIENENPDARIEDVIRFLNS